MNTLERTLEHYRYLFESCIRRLEMFEFRPKATDYSQYTKFICVKCFVSCQPSSDNTCGNCWKVGDTVKDRITGETFIVKRLYTFHNRYGTMTGVEIAGNYYEYFNARLVKV